MRELVAHLITNFPWTSSFHPVERMGKLGSSDHPDIDFTVNNLDSMEPIVTPEQAVKLCDRNFGIGADGVIFAMPGCNGTDYTMRIFISDGSEPGVIFFSALGLHYCLDCTNGVVLSV
ncbi:hypothetical protein L1987_50237 [Smallanthus sonchifolius]|uniref:Uncharacterized protein n=1 Tax=Smallanthus sonchifolius TaxID=185202 RepID=A0ACB9ELP0_9ASTR|nr:hypothetical protein L1987_50237 [Smallanthus sonchifolius]